MTMPLRHLLVSCVVLTTASAALAQITEARPAAAPVAPAALLALPREASPRDAATKSFPEAVPTIETGLAWLLAHQSRDGRWDADEFLADSEAPVETHGLGRPTNDLGLTGLVLFALAREGKAPQGDPRRAAIDRASAWLVGQQQDDGLLGTQATQDYIYGHAIGTLGLCTAALATNDDKHLDAVKQAVGRLEAHRNRFAVWRYQKRDNDNDSSVTTWAILALLAARELSVAIDPAAMHAVRTWFQAVTTPEGHAGYSRAGEKSSRHAGDHIARFPPEHGEAMTAAALLCRSLLGESPATTPVLAASAKRLLAKAPTWDPTAGSIDTCYWFFASEALRHSGGEARTAWARSMVAALVKGQRVDAEFRGSWDPSDVWGHDGGRVYTTAMAVLALQGLYGRASPPAPK